jgi:hypothetical protein
LNTKHPTFSGQQPATCPSLRDLAGDTYRVEIETAPAQKARVGSTATPWLATIPTRSGHLFPFGNETLGVWVQGRRRGLVEKLEKVGAQIRTVGDDGYTLICSVGLFTTVAEIVGARKRRHPSPEAVQRGREALARVNAQRHRQSGFRPLISPPAAEVDLEHVQASSRPIGNGRQAER